MKKGRKFIGGKHDRYDYGGPDEMRPRKRYQAGWEHDGLSFEEVVKAQVPQDRRGKPGGQARADAEGVPVLGTRAASGVAGRLGGLQADDDRD